jgi:hypothetical protein
VLDAFPDALWISIPEPGGGHRTFAAFMMFKPFKPPLAKAVTRPVDIDLTIPDSDSEDQPHEYRPTKKRRLVHVVDDTPPVPKATSSAATLASRKPLLVVSSSAQQKPCEVRSDGGHEGYYLVLWYASGAT